MSTCRGRVLLLSVCLPAGSEFDMMSRRVIAASSAAVANRIAQVVEAFPCRRDDDDLCRCVCGASGVNGV